MDAHVSDLTSDDPDLFWIAHVKKGLMLAFFVCFVFNLGSYENFLFENFYMKKKSI